MIVTRIEEMSRSRSGIYLDESFAFVLYKGELRLYGIREGKELSETAYRQIMEELLPKRACLRCMNLLKSRAYTEKQLRDKLGQGRYPAVCADAALEYVKSFHYVDDDRFARDYIENQKDKKSKRIMEMDLMKKGISKEIIEKAFLDQLDEGIGPDEEALARMWAVKKRFDPKKADYKEKQKMSAFLYRKGIGREAIRKVLSCDWEIDIF